MTVTRIPPSTKTRAQAASRWLADAGGLAAAIGAAVALWALVVAGIASPLGAALARLDGHRAPRPAQAASADPCPLPAGALASAARAEPVRCR